MNISNNISKIYDGFFGVIAMILATILLSTSYTYPALLIFVVIIYIFSLQYLKIIVEIYRLESLSKSPMLNCYQEIFNGIIFLKHSVDNTQIVRKFQQLVDVNQKNLLADCIVGLWYGQTISFLFLFIYTALLIANYYDSGLNGQQASIALYMSILLSEQISSFVMDLQAAISNLVYVQRCAYLMNEIPREQEEDIEKELQPNEIFLPPSVVESEIELPTIQSLNQLPVTEFVLEVNQLSARYRTDLDLVLRDINFKLREKEKITIIGRTGSGKTSIVQCLTRLIDLEPGSNIICYGKSFENSTIDQTRPFFSVIPQDPFVFEGTIHENIDPYMRTLRYSIEALNKVIKEYTNKNIPLLDNPSDKVDELGKNLSLGERQLLVLIRTLLQNRKMVILDECTGNLDQEYSDIILNMLDIYIKDKTVINITHKFDTIREYDHILLIDEGKMLEIGNVQQVLHQYQNYQKDIKINEQNSF